MGLGHYIYILLEEGKNGGTYSKPPTKGRGGGWGIQGSSLDIQWTVVVSLAKTGNGFDMI